MLPAGQKVLNRKTTFEMELKSMRYFIISESLLVLKCTCNEVQLKSQAKFLYPAESKPIFYFYYISHT